MPKLLSVRAVSPIKRTDLQALKARLDAGDVGTFDLQEMLAYPEEERDINWLKIMVQHAVQLEFATIPPYLTAYRIPRPIQRLGAMFHRKRLLSSRHRQPGRIHLLGSR